MKEEGLKVNLSCLGKFLSSTRRKGGWVFILEGGQREEEEREPPTKPKRSGPENSLGRTLFVP